MATSVQNNARKQYKNTIHGQFEGNQSHWSPLSGPAAKRTFPSCHFPRHTNKKTNIHLKRDFGFEVGFAENRKVGGLSPIQKRTRLCLLKQKNKRGVN